jgi:hypothetical protein
MAEYKDIVKLAVDSYNGRVEKYTVGQSQDALHQALVEANGGSTTLNYKAIRDGKCNGLFTLLEEILSKTVIEGVQENDFFNAFVDYKNVAIGDKNVFVVEDSTLFVVDDVAEGNQGIRRQRLGGKSEVSIPTSMHAIRIYEELNRVLSGRVDFNVFIDKVSKSFSQKILNDIYTLWAGATAADLGGAAYYPTAGTYSEDDLLDVISHVEAAAGGQTATIVGTKKALRNLKESIMSDGAKDEFHNMGYAGTFFGTPVVAIPQRHQVGNTNFVFQDDVLTIVAGSDRPIKFIYEGDPLVIMGDPKTNADLTQEYFYAERYGLGLVLAGGNAGIGRYEW